MTIIGRDPSALDRVQRVQRVQRVVLTLTVAQAGWLRGAVRSHCEDMSISGMFSKTDERMADNILQQLSAPTKVIK